MPAATNSADFVISRVFDAPRELVWKAFTDPEHMKEWWGPKGSVVVASKMDFRVGGTYHGAMRDPAGNVMWAKFVYREIVAPERLVGSTRSRMKGGLTRHPLQPDLAAQILTTVTFDEPRKGRDRVDAALVAARRDGGGAKDLRRRARRHAWWLGRYVRAAHGVLVDAK